MNILTKIKSSYKKWQDEADQRAEKAIKKAETANERDKIRSKLAIEKADRKREIALAVAKQKEAEAKVQSANKKLKSNSNSFSWLDSIVNYGSKPKKTTIRKRKSTRKTTKKSRR